LCATINATQVGSSLNLNLQLFDKPNIKSLQEQIIKTLYKVLCPYPQLLNYFAPKKKMFAASNTLAYSTVSYKLWNKICAENAQVCLPLQPVKE
jgi:hypothetical protein